MFVRFEKRKQLGFGIVLSIRNTDIGATYLSVGLGMRSLVIGKSI